MHELLDEEWVNYHKIKYLKGTREWNNSITCPSCKWTVFHSSTFHISQRNVVFGVITSVSPSINFQPIYKDVYETSLSMTSLKRTHLCNAWWLTSIIPTLQPQYEFHSTLTQPW